MMNFFEKELLKMVDKIPYVKNPKFVGSAAVFRVSNTITGKITFTTAGLQAGHYTGIKIKLMNRNSGEIDNISIFFNDIWRFSERIHAWTDRTETSWYNYTPTNADYRNINSAIADYLENFTD